MTRGGPGEYEVKLIAPRIVVCQGCGKIGRSLLSGIGRKRFAALKQQRCEVTHGVV